MRRSARALCLLAALLLAAPATAQEPEKPTLAKWAPRWRVGDWWEVQTYQREDTSERPQGPKDPLSEPLKGITPLREGVPMGFFKVARFRLEVVRRESVTYDDAGADAPPELFLVVALTRLEAQSLEAELWFTRSDLSLAQVVIDPKGEARKIELQGYVQLSLPLSGELGFPLDWPDARKTKKKEWKLELRPKRGKVSQEVQVNEAGDEVRVKLSRLDRDGKTMEEVKLHYQRGIPFWRSLTASELYARVVKHHQVKRKR